MDDARISVMVEGRGPPVVLLHSSAASHRQWPALIERLTPTHKVYAPDFFGHGGTDRQPKDRNLTFADDVALVRTLLAQINTPVHLVGHSYGGAIALALGQEKPSDFLSLTLFEPVAFYLLKPFGEMDALAEIEALVSDFQAAIHRGDLEACGARFNNYWMGPGSWEGLDEKRRSSIMKKLPAISDIWDMVSAEYGDLATYRSMQTRTLLLSSQYSTEAARAVIRGLTRILPDNRALVLKDCTHMAPFTHPDLVNSLIEDFIAESVPCK